MTLEVEDYPALLMHLDSSHRRYLMPKTFTAREHWKRAVGFYWKGDRRRTIREARLAMELNPNYFGLHRIVVASTCPPNP
jgi:hypothetical protein